MVATGSRQDGDRGEGGMPYLPPTSEAFRTAVRALHYALKVLPDDPAVDPYLSDSVTSVVTRGRADGLQAEHLIIAFAQLWDADPILPRGSPHERDRLRRQVVSALITGHYSYAPYVPKSNPSARPGSPALSPQNRPRPDVELRP